MKRVLVAHPWMERGGSEATAMWVLTGLQDVCEVTFVTASPIDWDELNEAYGSRVDPSRIRLIRSRTLPGIRRAEQMVFAQLRCFEAFCRKIAGDFDLCVSAYHPIWFGRPGIQLIGDFSFSEEMRSRLYIHGEERFVHRDTALRRFYLRLARLIGSDAPPLRERGDLVLANSRWSAGQLRDHFGVVDAPVLYPPVILPKAPADSERDPLGFVCLGRVVPEKEIERVVTILETVRERGRPVTLRLIGALDGSDYSRRVGDRIGGKDWIRPEGFLTLERKHEVLASQSFALHGCRIEAFGIAVAEMASMGCVPLVPDTGGAGEIVGLPELQYGSNDEAVEKIERLIDSPERVGKIREQLTGAMNRFGPGGFVENLRDHVLGFQGPSRVGHDGYSRKDLAARH